MVKVKHPSRLVGAFVGALLCLANAVFPPCAPAFAQSTADGPMEYVELCDAKGRCIKISKIILGSDHLEHGNWAVRSRPELPEAQVVEIIDEAVRSGVTAIDTSQVYVGGVESLIGRYLKARPDLVREGKFHVLTKWGFPFDLTWMKSLPPGTHSAEFIDELNRRGMFAPVPPSWDGWRPLQNVPAGTYASRQFGSAEQIASRIREEVGHSVGNLNGPPDWMILHRPDRDVVDFRNIRREPNSPRTILKALATPEIADNFRILGLSNWPTAEVEAALAAAKADPSLPRVQTLSNYFSLFEMNPDRPIHAAGVQMTHAEAMNPDYLRGVVLHPYSPLGGFPVLDTEPGQMWFAAKARAKELADQGDLYWRNVHSAIFTPENEARFNRLVQFTADFNRAHGSAWTADQMANAWVLAHPRVDTVTIGPTTLEELRRTLASRRLARMLTPDDLEFLYSGTRKTATVQVSASLGCAAANVRKVIQK